MIKYASWVQLSPRKMKYIANHNSDSYIAFYVQETNQIEYLIPEESSLEHHLQISDVGFIDFMRNLLELNPLRRLTAKEALEHPWLSHSYWSSGWVYTLDYVYVSCFWNASFQYQFWFSVYATTSDMLCCIYIIYPTLVCWTRIYFVQEVFLHHSLFFLHLVGLVSIIWFGMFLQSCQWACSAFNMPHKSTSFQCKCVFIPCPAVFVFVSVVQ